ncbi:MAG TPA: AMP-dependent synthetase [Clostridiales bacterium]|nr:AMP-dependent synthetase [Clostridiales bacterium]
MMKEGIQITHSDGKRIVKGRGYYQSTTIHDVREVVKGAAKNFGDSYAFRFKDEQGNITGKTFVDFDTDIDALGTALHAIGLKNTCIAIIGENRYEWAVSYLSVINGTGVAVPLDKHLPANEVKSLIERGKVEAIFYSPAYQAMMEEAQEELPSIKYFICMEKQGNNDSKFTSLPELVKKGKQLLSKGDRSFINATIDREKMSILLFTSGTTAMAKGVMLSHKNIASNVNSITQTIQIFPGEVHLSLLPYHHTFENTIGLIHMVHVGVCIAYCDGIKHVAKNLQEYNVSLLVAVPAIFDVMFRRLQEGIRKAGKENLVNTLINLSEFLRKIGIDLRKKLFKSIRDKFAPALRLAVSGAAPLDPAMTIWFEKIGVVLLEGYGLTETSPVVSANNLFAFRPGTIGQPLADIEVSIDAPDENGMGEIIVRGDNVMLGYYEDQDATNEVFEKGWFKTGDLGFIDDEGYIKITGRAKSMIVLDNGKKAFPEEFEVLINNIPGVKDSFVWGNITPDKNVEICAELVIDQEYFSGNIPSEQELAKSFDQAIKEINKTIPQYKIIRYFLMTKDELIKTTTLKIKRRFELEKVQSALAKSNLDMRKASGKFI